MLIGQTIPEHVERAAGLTPYATVLRYAGIEQRVSTGAQAEATETADAVVRWAEEYV